MSLVLFWSDRFAAHAPPPGHPERVERATVMRAAAGRWREGGGRVLAPRRAPLDDVHRVHAPAYVEWLKATAGQAAVVDADTFTSAGSWDAALLAAGALVEATDRVLADRPLGAAPGETQDLCAALALVRPPGHHALRERGMGFCLLNNPAIAAAHALACGVERVAVVDYDVHHGNGTQWAFYDDPRVLFVSLHQYPFYPGTGAAGECGVGDGEGFTVNLPMAAGATDADYELAFEAVVEPVLDAFAPQLLIVDAGFDAHERDPLARMRMTTTGFGRVAGRLRRAAGRRAGGRLVMTVEGGYDLEALGASLDATIQALAAAGAPGEERPVDDDAPPTGAGRDAVALARAAQRRYWPGL